VQVGVVLPKICYRTFCRCDLVKEKWRLYRLCTHTTGALMIFGAEFAKLARMSMVHPHFLLFVVVPVQFLTACWSHVDNACPYHDHCEGRIIRWCTNGDEPGQGYRASQTDCGDGRTCTVAATGIPECVLDPLRPCTRSTCEGDAKIACGTSAYAESITDCTAAGRICRESATTAECVIPDAPCPTGKTAFCASDAKGIYGGCDLGFGYATELKTCPSGCGSPVCHEGTTDAACVDSPVKACTTAGPSCSPDRKLGLMCDKVGEMVRCATDCSKQGQLCMPSTGTCGYDIACTGSKDHECSPDGHAVYECDTNGHFVTRIMACDVSDSNLRCMSSTGTCGYDIACDTSGYECSADGRAIYLCNGDGHFVEAIIRCSLGMRCRDISPGPDVALQCN
jgi:hypothetical protein